MTKLIEDVVKNYISVLVETIPEMISQTTAANKLVIYCGIVLLYPLALIVLGGLVAVVFFAVSVVRPFVAADKTVSP